MTYRTEFEQIGVKELDQFVDALELLYLRNASPDITRDILNHAAYLCLCTCVSEKDTLSLLHIILNDIACNKCINNLPRLVQLSLILWSIYYTSSESTIVHVYSTISFCCHVSKVQMDTLLEETEIYAHRLCIAGVTFEKLTTLLIQGKPLKEVWRTKKVEIIRNSVKEFNRARRRWCGIPYMLRSMRETVRDLLHG